MIATEEAEGWLKQAGPGTWHVQRDWLMQHKTQQELLDLSLRMTQELDSLNEKNPAESKIANHIRDILTVFWYAMDEDTTQDYENELVSY